MNHSKLAAVLLLLGLATPVSAQTVPQDVRCLLLSNMFAKSASEDRGRQAAAQTLIYFIGRIEARANAATITSAMRAQSRTIDAKTAGVEMDGCAARAQRAEQMVQAAGRAATSTK